MTALCWTYPVTQPLFSVFLFPAEGFTHPVPGAGAGEPQGGAGDQDQPAAPEGEEADGDGQTGERPDFRDRQRTSALTAHSCDPFAFQVETNVRLEEVLKKVQQENEDYKARMDKHAALSK